MGLSFFFCCAYFVIVQKSIMKMLVILACCMTKLFQWFPKPTKQLPLYNFQCRITGSIPRSR